MDNCPAALVAHILGYLSPVDLGKTARSLGLVSKYYRRIAKSFEFRALVVFGSEQLKATLSRIKSEQEERGNGAVVDVRHLCICEEDPDIYLKAENISGASKDGEDVATRNVKRLNVYAKEFRKNAAALIRNVHTTLVTLSLTQRSRTTYYFDDLSIISDLSLPRLEALILNHADDISDFDFVHPTAPLLRRIRLNAPHVYYNTKRDRSDYEEENPRPHPLLADMHSHFEALTHLVVHGGGMDYVEDVLEVLCGSRRDARKLESTIHNDRRLPGRLVHAVVNPLYENNLRRTKDVCQDVRALRIDGLDVHDVQWQIGELWEHKNGILKDFEEIARERWWQERSEILPETS